MNRIELFARSCGDIRFGEPMSVHTYYRIGGPAEIFAVPADEKELNTVIRICEENSVPYFILGKGSNLIVSDGGYAGCVIDMTAGFQETAVEGELLAAGAGCTLAAVARTASANSLSGFEELAGIPGSVGGALVMNAGCYGKEIGPAVRTVHAAEKGKNIVLDRGDIDFSYRSSSLKGRVITRAVFGLVKDDPEKINERMAHYARLRKEKQPLNLPSCGSVFKRPAEGFAGKYIEECGLKGTRIGGAEVSELHAGFIVNRDGASASDVISLIELIKSRVKEKFGVSLEEEVIRLGFYKEEV